MQCTGVVEDDETALTALELFARKRRFLEAKYERPFKAYVTAPEFDPSTDEGIRKFLAENDIEYISENRINDEIRQRIQQLKE